MVAKLFAQIARVRVTRHCMHAWGKDTGCTDITRQAGDVPTSLVGGVPRWTGVVRPVTAGLTEIEGLGLLGKKARASGFRLHTSWMH